MKPNVVEEDAWSEPLNEALLTDTAEPLVLGVPFQTWVMVWSPPSAHFTVHPLIAELPAVTVISPW
jgi:hypothetical protein